MGSYVTLTVGRFEVDWGKNQVLNDHGKLFLPGDLTFATDYYARGAGKKEPAFLRPLSSVRRRLELLGYSLKACRKIYEENTSYAQRYEDVPDIGFPEFKNAVAALDVTRGGVLEDEGDYDPGEYAVTHVLEKGPFKALVPDDLRAKRDLGLVLENLDPYVVLRLLAENPRNLPRRVTWRHADLVDGGWIEENELKPGLTAADKYLVVTEGSSDSKVLRESLFTVAPDVADFFDFIDMSENYPFTGTGNLVRFCQGLARIQIQNKVLVVFDNDTAGWDALARVEALDLPPRMRLAVLPDLRELRQFPTLGPSGSRRENVNRKAASIELYLGLRGDGRKKPTVRWTSYNEKLDRYQGELVGKESYVRAFLAARKRGTYDMTKLGKVWEALIAACVAEDA